MLPYPLDKILKNAHSLLRRGALGSGATRVQVAAAFVVERLDLLPRDRGVVEAWESLGVEWQFYVKHLRQDHRALIEALETSAAAREGG
ncbi:hypothetical protein [Microbulbifer halophilus]|uniref:Uncharacterized protein n=1 Tax=Microbulbifer halophilus TaxID=453963 RepID=A0ABW5ECD4_9GAMM|nr:hypothetical protein [Microbulbifer halophilus]MCW8125109.1 hypothetical protein [Microbulbifer halophilus]